MRRRLLPRSKRRRRPVTLALFGEILKQHYRSDESLAEAVNAKAAEVRIHPVRLQFELGWDVVPPHTTARDRRVAKRVVKRWQGSKRPMSRFDRRSPLFRMLAA